MNHKTNILFLCTGNSCRSQMAEGLTKHFAGDKFNAFSAGIETHGLNPNAVKVMQEIGIDITSQKSELIEKYASEPIDIVVTVCASAHETCPIFPGNCKVVHAGFDDPPALAKQVAADGGSQDQQLDCYRNVRDQIKSFISNMPENLN